jgi:hypothetical protein
MTVNNKQFFAGQEEIFARLAGFMLTNIGFLIYIFAKPNSIIERTDWVALMLTTCIFWFVYEFLSIILFQAFIFFSKNKEMEAKLRSQENTTQIPSQNTETSEIIENK